MQTTRQRILQYLNLNRQATAPELSRVLTLTQANIRHHLGVLEEEGHVEVIGQTTHSTRGRPTYIYMLTKSAQTDGLDILASALLAEGAGGGSDAQKQKFLRKTAQRIAGTDPQEQKSITIQLSQAVQRLNDLDYKAHWEAHAESPHIFLGICPYAKIIQRHPELCRMDAALIKHLTGREFTQVEKISRRQDGPTHCRFVLDNNH
ncbi:MAG: helix-turn-helix domain-containing protein [Anaerolineales bacterium]|jgi:predicted ArsR family transcriptional regulator